MEGNHYPKYLLMLTASFVVMYAVMFLNVAQFDHESSKPKKTKLPK